MNNDETLFNTLYNTIVLDSRDWSINKNDAFIYGIIAGWDEKCFEEFNNKFNWSSYFWEQLKILHIEFIEYKKLTTL